MRLSDISVKLQPEKNIAKIASFVELSILESIKKHKIKAKPVIAGSLAKGTNLRGDFDVDIFVKFDMLYKSENLSDMLKKVLHRFRPAKVHGSRDYFQFRYKSVNFEVVPVLDIKTASEALNVTDVSPLHALWVKENIKNLAGQIRLAKKFCKSQGVYGAESYINGFSGYILEILVIHYGGFLKLLTAVSKWKPKQVIDTAHQYRSNKEVYKKLNIAKLQSPLIVIDPVQKDRNAAAALNIETFSKFILASKSYLSNPSLKFFQKPKFSIKLLRDTAKKYDFELVLLKIRPLEGKADVVGSKILKVYNYIKKQLTLNDFSVMDSGWEWNCQVHLWYYVSPKELSKFRKHPGPLVYSSDSHIKKFLSKHKYTVVEESKIVAITKRAFTNPGHLIKHLINDEYVKEKVKQIK